MAFKRWMYRGGRPNGLTKIINAGWTMIHALGIMPNYLVTLEVVGRQSGIIQRTAASGIKFKPDGQG